MSFCGVRTQGECLRNNWNSINDSKGAERSFRIAIQNRFSCSGIFDMNQYMKHLWNEKVEVNQ